MNEPDRAAANALLNRVREGQDMPPADVDDALRLTGDISRRRGTTNALRQWLLANPNEYLSLDDIARINNVTRPQAMKAVSRLQVEGTIASGNLYWLNPDRTRA